MYALEIIDPNNTTKFWDMYNFTHVNKKWFYLTSDHQFFILADNDLPPHSLYVTKEMSQQLCAVAHPCYNNTMHGGMES